MTHNHLHLTIEEVKKLYSLLKKSKQIQIRSNEEKNHIKAVVHSWYENHRKHLTIPENDRNNIDSFFDQMLQLSEKQPARQKVQSILKQLRDKLAKTHIQSLKEPSNHFNRTLNFSSLVSDEKMQTILQNRWQEIDKCLSVSAGLSAVIMMGGILEGLLMAKVNAFSDKDKLFKCRSIPVSSKTKKKIPLNQWTLKIYIEVAHEMDWISRGAKDVGAILRDYRNLIHPQKELTQKFHISSQDAQLFSKITFAIIEELL